MPHGPYNLETMSMHLVGVPKLLSDLTPKSSDKTFTVPLAETWEIQIIRAKLSTTPVGGNRQLRVEILDSSSASLFEPGRQGNVKQGASLTRFYEWAPGAADMSAFMGGDYVSFVMPRLVLPAGFIIRVYDQAAIDPADSLALRMLVLERTEAGPT